MRNLVRNGAGALLLAALSPAAHAAETEPVAAAVVECRTQSDESARLRCYDAAVGELAAAMTAGDVVLVDRQGMRETRRSLFGLSLPKLPFFRGDDSQEEEVDEIEAKIQSASVDRQNKWTVVLDSGAVWRTTEPSRGFKQPEPGKAVTLKKGTMGGYWLRLEGERALRALRVR